MILPALIDYYHRLEKDKHEHPATFCFSREKIHFCLVLERDGSLASNRLDDLHQQVVINKKTGKTKLVPQSMVVPSRGGRSGSGFKPFFLWDNTGYVLGRDAKDNLKRAGEAFEGFRSFHLSFRDIIEDEDYQTVCRFLQSWEPARAKELENWEDAAGKNVVFQIRGQRQYVHQLDCVKQAWFVFRRDEVKKEQSTPGRSLISNQVEDIAQLHPLIGGVTGAQSTGAAIVSFNLDAFTSYAKAQSYNAPVSIEDAHRYTTALDHLLSSSKHRIRIGDATVVFWSQGSSTILEDAFGLVMGEQPISADDPSVTKQVSNFLNSLRQGKAHEQIDKSDVPFYVLGLSPNASRISVRFWLTGTVLQFAKRLDDHVSNLEIIGCREDDPPLIIRQLLWETVREPKEVDKQAKLLAGEIARAIFTGGAYPQTLLNAVIRRIRADPQINYRRAAIIKAVLIRNFKQEITVSLDVNYPDSAYHLGRLFAALDKTQEDVGLNQTIKKGYFSTASSTPASVFPRLMRMHQHHLDKLESQRPGQKVNREKLVQEIYSHIQNFPPHLPLQQQGIFDIGYYHQRQDFFTKKVDAKQSSPASDSQ